MTNLLVFILVYELGGLAFAAMAAFVVYRELKKRYGGLKVGYTINHYAFGNSGLMWFLAWPLIGIPRTMGVWSGLDEVLAKSWN